MLVLPLAHHGRRTEHDPPVSKLDPLEDQRGEGELQAEVSALCLFLMLTLSATRLTSVYMSDWESRCHMFYGQRVIDIPDGLPKWDGISGESGLIEDSPPDLVRENERKREADRAKRFEKGENK